LIKICCYNSGENAKMRKINDRFYLTDNGFLFDIDSNYVIKPLIEIDDVINLISSFNNNLNKNVLSQSEYADGANFAININLTSACNLDCVYCFAHGGDYGKQKDNMSVEILPALKNLILKNVTKSKKVRFEYFGGEPLLNERMIHSLVDYARVLENDTGIHILHRVSTNLTQLSDEMLQVLCDNDFVVSVSIDGNRIVQEKQRPSRNGKSSYETILKNVTRIKEKNPAIKTVARMTVAQKEITLFENIKDLVSTCLFNYVSIYPASIISSESGKYKYYFDTDIKRQYQEVFSRYSELCSLSSDYHGILEVERILDSLLNGKLSVSHCSAGKNYCTLSSDCSIVTCHRLCGQQEFILNNDGSGELKTFLQQQWSQKVDDDLICSTCFARYICGGGCKQEHISYTGNFVEKNIDACAYRIFLLEEIISNIENLSLGFQERYIPLDDMFVYCGQPVVKTKRITLPKDTRYYIFRTE